MAIAHTAHGGATGGTHNGTSIAVTVTAAVNETIIVYVAGTSGITASVTDNASPANTYTAGPSQSTNVSTLIFYSRNIANAPTTVTITLGGTHTEAAACVETYTGVMAVGNTGTNSGSSTAPAVTVTTQDTNNWIAMCGGAAGAGTWTATSPNEVWHSAFSATTGGEISSASADKGAIASAGAATVTVTLSASESWGAVGLELRSVLPAVVLPNFLMMLGSGL